MKLAVGFFDGVHLGHRLILSGADAAFTFRNHPATVLSPDRVPGLLMSYDERIAAISSSLRPHEGADARVVSVSFTEEMSRLSPQDFVSFLRRDFPGLKAIRCGENWRFGAGGAGNAEFVRGLGLAVEEVPFAMYDGAAVSSTRIRNALAEGDIDGAAKMLGRRWSMTGRPLEGKGEGRKMGFPTINLRPFEGSVPLRCGVYAVKTELGAGIANWGVAPTMAEASWKERILEVHLLLDAKNGSYMPPLPPEMTVTFLRFVREEIRFQSREALIAQIAVDCDAVRSDFANASYGNEIGENQT